MNILLISQCHKNALKETRRIIDQFAERTGERSWQTHITEKGLQALHRLLRKTARKNTAVACHWIHGKNHSELLWIVGDRSQFNDKGRVPTNRTQRNILRTSDENPRISACDIQIVAVLAALLHDLGKATLHFQNKLQKNHRIADEYRHEWISLRLFRNMLSGCLKDTEWLFRLANWATYREQNPEWFVLSPEPPKNNRGDEYNFSDLPPLARIIAWLIVSHHRLPISEKYNTNNNDDFQKKTKFDTLDDWFSNFIPTENWVYQSHADSMKYDLAADPTQSPVWQKMLSRWANKALQRIEAKQFFGTNADGDLSCLLQDPLFLHLSRLCLMVGDHYFSAKKYSENNQKKYALPLWANTDKNAHEHAKQLLDEHLCGVADIAKQFAHVFLWADKPFAALNKCKELSKPAQESRFFWQNTAFELGRKLHHSSQEQGFFGVNTAGTGCGKTLANAKIAYALSGEKQTRITIALGLRTLTLQTGEALRKKLHLTDNEIATLIGSSAIKQLFENNQDKTHHGSESADDAYFHADETFAVMRDESAFADNIYRFLMPDNKTDNKIKTLLDTPIIACTIDHLMQVCEQQRSAHFVPPMLRLLSSDIVLDEPDDFSTEDLPALSRLIYWIGLCGGRLLLSSATLTPDLCEGLFRAYQDGRRIYNKHFGLPENKIVCAWFNEFNTHAVDCGEQKEYREQHTEFCKKQINQLQTLPIRRKAEILPLDNADYPQLAERFISAILELHARHGIEYQQQKISIGLLRFANIDPLIATARAMLQLSTALPDTQLHITCYHGRQLLFLRSRIEEILDRLLHRNNPTELFRQPEIKQAIQQNPAKNHIFVVFGSPVTEVGRDHDYDWAIVEPSSLRSLIQLAGRVWRHRPEKVADTANIMVFNKNIKHLTGKEICYEKPGFEKKGFYRLNPQQKSAQNSALLSDEILQRIDAQARLKQPREQFTEQLQQYKAKLPERNKEIKAQNLTDLEHIVMADLINAEQNFITAYRLPESVFHLTCDCQRKSPFRYDPQQGKQIAYTALPNDDDTINWIQSENLAENLDSKNYDNKLFERQTITSQNSHIHLWLNCSYQDEFQTLAAELNHCEMDDLSEKQIRQTAIQYAGVNLYDNKHYLFNEWLGFEEAKVK